MGNECCELALTIDTREKNQKRISAVRNWFERHGGAVEHAKLDLCDYHIQGTFRCTEIDIGIEAKSMSDFAGSMLERTTLNLRHKLADAYRLYHDVALFVEAGDYGFTTLDDDFHAIIKNQSVRDGSADTLQLALFENALESFQACGIHVRQLRSEHHFPYAIAGLLIYLYNPIHTGIEIQKDKSYEHQYLNVVSKIPGVGYKTAQKLMRVYPNMFWLSSASENNLQETIGQKKGAALYGFLRNHLLETDTWKQSSFYEKNHNQKVSSLTTDERRYFEESMRHNHELMKLLSQGDTEGLLLSVPSCHSDGIISKTTTPCPSDDIAEAFTSPISSAVNSNIQGTIPLYNTPQGNTCFQGTEPCFQAPSSTSTSSPVFKTAPGSSCYPDKSSISPDAPGFQESGDRVRNNDTVSEIPQSDSNDTNPQYQVSPPLSSAVSPPTYKMSLRAQIFGYLSQSHSLQEIVDAHDEFEKGYVWETVMKMKRDGEVSTRGEKYVVRVSADQELDVGV